MSTPSDASPAAEHRAAGGARLTVQDALRKLRRAGRFLAPDPVAAWRVRRIRRSGLFDPDFYLKANPGLNRLFRRFPERHYLLFGEAAGLWPSPFFSPGFYREAHGAQEGAAQRPLLHYIARGHGEGRATREGDGELRTVRPPDLAPGAATAPFAVVAHVYYPDLWPELAERLAALDIAFDLFVTLADRGAPTEALRAGIAAAFPEARLVVMPNHGRDVFPFVHLVNAGLLSPYRAVCKIHTKRSPHRDDGGAWRSHLVAGLLPGVGTAARLEAFLADRQAAIWVADGQHYHGDRWWSVNREATLELLARVEVHPGTAPLAFPAGSMYWLSPPMVAMIGAMRLDEGDFEPEHGQVDGTRAHAFERAVGFLPGAAGMAVRETAELGAGGVGPEKAPDRPRIGPGSAPDRGPGQGSGAGVRGRGPGRAPVPESAPGFVSAVYLPRFYPAPEAAPGFSDWQAAAGARPMFPDHPQPALPGVLGFYDLRLPDVMGAQAALARAAGIDAFCVQHYWCDDRRAFAAPLDALLARPEIDFPFYLLWENEPPYPAGQALPAQTYGEGFEEALAEDTRPYLADPRQARPDARRPRFAVARPDALPAPAATAARLRAAWRRCGLGEVELGAVHVPGATRPGPDPFDFRIEMPPLGLAPAALARGSGGWPGLDPAFRGRVGEYDRLIETSLDPGYATSLPADTVAGAMPGWDTTALAGRDADIAVGAHPGAFRRWLDGLARHRLGGSYRGELMLYAWNAWAEKAVLEPDRHYGRARLDVLRAWRGGAYELRTPSCRWS